MTCEYFSVRAWKVSPSFVNFSTTRSNLIWAELGTYSSLILIFCWLEILSEDFDAASWNLRRNGQHFLPVYHEASRRGSWSGCKPQRLVIHGSVWLLFQRVLPERQSASSSFFHSRLMRSLRKSLSISLDLLRQNQGVSQAVAGSRLCSWRRWGRRRLSIFERWSQSKLGFIQFLS